MDISTHFSASSFVSSQSISEIRKRPEIGPLDFLHIWQGLSYVSKKMPSNVEVSGVIINERMFCVAETSGSR